jgi:hypothetical protein
MSDLDAYKKNKIQKNKEIFNSTVVRLYSILQDNIKIIQKSKLSNNEKKKQINNIINQCKEKINVLRSNLEKSIVSINSLVPKKITINKNKKALLIGINYTGTSNELYGCINDVTSISDRIKNQGFTDINILTDSTDKKATRDNILEEFTKLLINSQAGDLLVFTYSGHGSYIIDRNGDETDGRDELIVSCDLKEVLDDELKSLIQQYLKPDVTLFALFDSCFSGSVLDLKYQYLDSLNYDKYTENPKQLDTPGNVLMISGCTDNQTSADSVFKGKPNGAMTWSLVECLIENRNYTWRELVKSMRNKLKDSKFEQIPQFSSGNFVDIDKEIFI